MGHLQVNNEGVVDLSEQTLLQLDVVNLLQVDDLCLLQRFQRHWFVV